MKLKVAKWGNSLAVRLPKKVADELGLQPGSIVDLEKQGSRLAIETAQPGKIPHYRLEDLLAQIKPGMIAPPFEDWGILPSEWPVEDWSDVAPSDDEWEALKAAAAERHQAAPTPKGKSASTRRRA
jgi:antitoxin MazE